MMSHLHNDEWSSQGWVIFTMMSHLHNDESSSQWWVIFTMMSRDLVFLWTTIFISESKFYDVTGIREIVVLAEIFIIMNQCQPFLHNPMIENIRKIKVNQVIIAGQHNSRVVSFSSISIIRSCRTLRGHYSWSFNFWSTCRLGNFWKLII